MKFKNLSIGLFFSVVSAALICLIFYFFSSSEATPNQAGTPSPNQNNSVTSYSDAAFGISFSYPSAVFNLIPANSTIWLESPYYVLENFKGTPDGEFKHGFTMRFDWKEEPLAALLQKANAEGASAITTSRALSGFMFEQGIEGINIRTYFFPKNDQETLVVEVSYFTDFLKSNVRPTAFSEAAVMSAIDTVLNSLEFFNSKNAAKVPADWPTYQNRAFHYTIQYPPEFSALEGIDPVTQSGIPAETSSAYVIISDMPKVGEIPGREYAGVRITVYFNTNLESWLKTDLDNFSDSAEIISNRSTTFSGAPAREVIGSGNLSSVYRLLAIPREPHLLIISQDLETPELNQVLESFVFLNS
ncbi:MAG: hypothetical protein Q7K39_01650 [Candidatus Magasanikbacteria bacterium]|nr:hypothetical protein [Candidatus Magasanikbacteria bacterium]